MDNTPSPPEGERPARSSAPRDNGWELVQQAVKGIRYGEVRVIIQDGVVVQIDRVEKQRLR